MHTKVTGTLVLLRLGSNQVFAYIMLLPLVKTSCENEVKWSVICQSKELVFEAENAPQAFVCMRVY